MPSNRVIDLSGDSKRKSGKGAGAITPGHLLERDAGAETVSVHSVAAGTSHRLIARENDLLGKKITDAYADGDDVQMLVMVPGNEYNMIASEAIALNDYVESAGDGRVRVRDAAAATAETSRQSTIGIAREVAALAGDRVAVEAL